MRLVCLDLEGVLIPEIWIAFSDATGIPELRRTTREEPDYDKLMRSRITLLAQNKLKLADIQRVISGMYPLPGAVEFIQAVKERTQLIILSDTFEQFAKPLMAKLSWPTLFCNSLVVDKEGMVTDYKMRQPNGKREAIRAFKSLNSTVFAAGDSYNDLDMIYAADTGCLFLAPEIIRQEHPNIPHANTFKELLAYIDKFLLSH